MRGVRPARCRHGREWARFRTRKVVGHPPPSPIPFDEGYESPRELTEEELCGIVHSFAQAARRALEAGFLVAEIHAAHGYLLQEFLSPLSNHRTDRYGGCFDNRIRLLSEVVSEVRQVWPGRLPLFVRI